MMDREIVLRKAVLSRPFQGRSSSMANGQFPGRLHPRTTQRSNHQYFFYDKHHRADYSEDAQWLPDMTHDQEFAVFDLADFHDLSNAKGDLDGLRLSPERSVAYLGTRNEQVAEFPIAQSGHPWHGYPCWPITRLNRDKRELKYSAPKVALEKMKQAGLLTENQRKRLVRGKHL
jgi:hypothetical protein